jgi:hypothetical protein
VDLQGYRFGDTSDSFAFARAFTIPHTLVIQPGESVIFVEGMSPRNFSRWWGADNLWPDLKIVSFDGFGFASVGEEINLWNGAATDPLDFVAAVSFASSLPGFSLECDSDDLCLVDSVPGLRGAFRALETGDVGSPGYTSNPPPRLLGLTRDASEVRLKVRANEGASYHLLYKADLSDPAWTPVRTFTATDSIVWVSDETAAGAGARFYRVEEIR